MKMHVNWTSTTRPGELSVSVDWGDGSFVNDLEFYQDGTLTLQHRFHMVGLMNVQVRVFNKASVVIVSEQVAVCKRFVGLRTSTCQTPELPRDSGCLPGQGAEENTFFSNQDVTFRMMNDSGRFEVTASKGTSKATYNRTSNPFQIRFQGGTWTVKIRAFNPMYSATTNTKVVVLETITGFVLTHRPEERSPGKTKTFSIQFQTLGTQTCLRIDFGDGNQALYANDPNDCNGLTAAGGTVEGPLSRDMSVRHLYVTERFYRLTATARDSYFSLVKQIKFDITTQDCNPPEVKITFACGDLRKPCVITRNRHIFHEAIPVTDCVVSQDNLKNWTVETVDEAWGNVTGRVDLQALGVNTTVTQLSLRPRTLEVGLYRLTFSMAMRTENPQALFLSTDHSYLQVRVSDLVGLMEKGGTAEIVRGLATGYLRLEPLTHSYDPDVSASSAGPQAGLSIKSWSCENVSDAEPNVCPDLLARAKVGPGVLLSYPIFPSMVGQAYRIGAVVVAKDGRSADAFVQVHIQSGDPAQVAIICSSGSVCYQRMDGYLVIVSERLSLLAECQNCAPEEVLQHRWNISVEDGRFPNGWRPLQQIEVAHNRTLGLSSKELSILPTLFMAYPNHKTYRVECNISRPNREFGWAVTRIMINDPPKGGECTIEPKKMHVTTEKLFRIRCKNWTDDMGIAEFVFFSYVDAQRSMVQITSVRADGRKKAGVEVNVSVSEGARWLCYRNTVLAAIHDTLGAQRIVKVGTVQVLPISVEKIVNTIDTMRKTLSTLSEEGVLVKTVETVTGASGMLNSYRYQTTNTRMVSKYAAGLGPYYSYTSETELGCDLEKPHADTGAGDQTTEDPSSPDSSESGAARDALAKYEEERDTRAKNRTHFLRLIVGLPKETMLGRTQILSAICELTLHPDEITGHTQLMIAKTLEEFASRLDDGEEVSLEVWEQHWGYLLAATASVMDAAGTSGLTGTLTELAKAGDSDQFQDYPTDVKAEDDICFELVNPYNQNGRSLDEALDTQILMANCVRQRGVARQVVEILSRAMEKMWRNYMQRSATGTSKQFNSGHTSTSVITVLAGAFGIPKPDFSEAEVTLLSDVRDILCDDSVNDTETVLIQMSENTNSPHRYTRGAISIPVSTRFVSLHILREGGFKVLCPTALPKPLRVTIPQATASSGSSERLVEYHVNSWNRYQLYKANIQAAGASLHVKMCPLDRGVQYVLVFSLGAVPDPQQGHCQKVALVPAILDDAQAPACSYVSMDNEEVGGHVGDVYVGVRQLNNASDLLNVTAWDCAHLPVWPTGSQGANGSYRFQVFLSACYSISEGEEDWTTRGCRVHEDTNERATVCECTRLADTFAGGWTFGPNAIDWNSVFSNADFHRNPTLYATQIIVCLLYVAAFVWARRKDRGDVERIGLAPLVDNDPSDRYYYEIYVQTSIRANAGTDSKVFFILSGEDRDTSVREFSDSRRQIFQRGSTDGFLMATPGCLGELIVTRVWHDNSGKGDRASWYLNYLMVRDVQTRQRWCFFADTWLAVEEGDGRVERLLPAASADAATRAFSASLAEQSRHDLAEDHLWFSVLARPPHSPFTRVQRVSCCLCLLYVSMLANAMFYEQDGEGSGPRFSVGPLSITLKEIYTGVSSNLIVFPINFLIITLFRKSRRRPQKSEPVKETRQTLHSGTSARESHKPVDVESVFTMSQSQSGLSDSRKGQLQSSFQPSADGDETLSGKKKKCLLPWWGRIVAWVLLWLATLTAVAFVSFYGLSFGDDKCRKWFISMLFSFLMSIFVTQPIKVMLVVLFLSLIVKRRGIDDDDNGEGTDREGTAMAKDEIPLHDWSRERPDDARPAPTCQPPDARQLEKARQKRLEELQMWGVLRKLLLYTFFFVVLAVISYRQRSYDAFLYKHSMERVFIHNDDTDISFLQVRNAEDFWTWARSGLINGIRASIYYNDYPPFLLRGYVNDKESKLLGYATMRQLRIQPALCEMDRRMQALMVECNAGYDIGGQDERTFDVGWTARADTNNSAANATTASENTTLVWYSYTEAEALDGQPYWGRLGLYAGGGYVVPLKGPKADLLALMIQLQEQNWIDRYTRAVFVEFTIYNAQVNLFGIATILSEFHPTGHTVQSFHFEPAMLLPYMDGVMVFQLLCEVVFCCFTLFFAISLVLVFVKEKLAFFKDFWNLVDLAIIALSMGGIVIYFYRLFEARKLARRVRETRGEEYVKFQYVAYWNELLTVLTAWLVFLVTIKFLTLLRFNRRVSMLAETLRHGGRTMLHFSLIFWIVFLAFTALFFLSFMTVDAKYSSFIGSMVACVLMLMGKFDIYTLTMAQPYLSQVLVFLFVLTLSFMVLNMFVSILTDTFARVRLRAIRQGNRHEILQFFIARLRRFLGTKKTLTSTVSPEERPESGQRWMVDDLGRSIEQFPERVESLLAQLSNMLAERQASVDEHRKPTGRLL
ncbi:uncharacterized protein LOC143280592 [Babylonia areolata]|uniref:uncharacterized protein LOC143280592 n=1 Tax=Babylonia areolata TaxID=304850 RepID=UPI003FD230DD